MKHSIVIFLVFSPLIVDLFAALPAPRPVRPVKTPELVRQQEQTEYEKLLESMGLAPIKSPTISPQPCKSPLYSQLIKRVLSAQK
jgi:hypothetical protein